MSRWFRHYAGMMRDEKLVRVAVRAKQPVHLVVWVWGAILESAAEINDNGRYEFDALEAAYFLRTTDDDIAAVVDGLSTAGHLVEGRVVKWGDRQHTSDSSADRQRRYRERRADKKVHDERNGDVTQPSRDADVTAPDTETDTELSEPSGSAAVAASDPRELLWREGLSRLKAITGKTDGSARQMLGKWCRDANDDCALILSKIQAAQRECIGDPVSWITAAIKPRDKPPKKITHASMWTDEAIALGIIDEPASTQDRRLGTSLARGRDQGPDFARRLTCPGNGEPADREGFVLPRA